MSQNKLFQFYNFIQYIALSIHYCYVSNATKSPFFYRCSLEKDKGCFQNISQNVISKLHMVSVDLLAQRMLSHCISSNLLKSFSAFLTIKTSRELWKTQSRPTSKYAVLKPLEIVLSHHSVFVSGKYVGRVLKYR